MSAAPSVGYPRQKPARLIERALVLKKQRVEKLIIRLRAFGAKDITDISQTFQKRG